MNRKPNDPLFPNEDEDQLKEKIHRQNRLFRPSKKENGKEKKKLTPLERLNRKVSIFLNPESIEISDDEKKKKIGVIITTLMVVVLIVSAYYFFIYEPSQKDLQTAQSEKLNQLHSLYKGPLASAPEMFNLQKQIKDSKNAHQIEIIDIVGPATKDWKSFQKTSINQNHDKFNRTMAVYELNESKSVIMPVAEALNIVNSQDVYVISNIKFEKPDTISVPILISRLQAGAGLVSVGSIVDIYQQDTMNTTAVDNESTPSLSGCTVLSIMRCSESGEIESEYGNSQTVVDGNMTNPRENTETFTANVIELIKGSLAGGYNEKDTINMLRQYGVRLDSYERQINLAEMDAQYLLLVEVPHDKVNFVLNNMENIVLTIPTNNAPEWMVNEISAVYE